ncbi:hypothetical protein G6F64_015072 [Rhizopus arrhizus]|uniref:Uncharacterized protein n=1 Tax=Rhizopus oryzae TaxID=64495 RepID=A0A9P6WS92_RHIOR|nr:hypothetical protein G6F64_015072 [Rhizopus arrhizus]
MKFRFWLASIETWQSSSAMSMCCPRPLLARSSSAARMPTVEYMPVIRSATATPAEAARIDQFWSSAVRNQAWGSLGTGSVIGRSLRTGRSFRLP